MSKKREKEKPEAPAVKGGSSAVLEAPPPHRKSLGALLVEAGCINSDQLRCALAVQQHTHGLLGEILVGHGFASEETIAEAVGRQTSIAFLRVPHVPIDPSLLGLVPLDVCRCHCLVPLEIKGSVIRVAMADPFNVLALDAIQASTAFVPLPAIAPRKDIVAAIDASRASVDYRLVVAHTLARAWGKVETQWAKMDDRWKRFDLFVRCRIDRLAR